MNQNKLVSIFITTYNHEQFIAKALDSVLMQRVNFVYEIVIGEDCSTDKTRETILEYANKYPTKFKLLLNKKNLGIEKNQMYTLSQCTGKYVAWLEGDDFWTNPNKLQMQVDFLEANPDFSGCCHYTDIIHKDGIIHQTKLTKDVLNIYDTLIGYTFFHTSSLVFINKIKLPKEYLTVKSGDYFIFNIVASLGYIKHLPIVMSEHLYHEKGLTQNKAYLADYHGHRIHLYKVMNKYFNYKYNDRFSELMVRHKQALKSQKTNQTLYSKVYSKLSKLLSN